MYRGRFYWTRSHVSTILSPARASKTAVNDAKGENVKVPTEKKADASAHLRTSAKKNAEPRCREAEKKRGGRRKKGNPWNSVSGRRCDTDAMKGGGARRDALRRSARENRKKGGTKVKTAEERTLSKSTRKKRMIARDYLMWLKEGGGKKRSLREGGKCLKRTREALLHAMWMRDSVLGSSRERWGKRFW